MSAYSQLRQDVAVKPQGSWVKQTETSQFDDTHLAATALEAIKLLTTVPSESIQVSAKNGCLHLEGTVNYPQQRIILQDVTRDLPGVCGIIDSITVGSVVR